MSPFPRRQFLRGTAGAAALLAASPRLALALAGDPPKTRGSETPQTTGRNPVPEDVAKKLPAWMETARVPGCAIAVLQRGAVTGVRVFGVCDTESQRPVVPDTVFEAASLSKVVTAYAALQLVQAGRLALDEPLVRYAPSPADADQTLAPTITLRHALTHSTGLRNWRFRRDDKLTVDFQPGSRFSYSGEGIIWVERAIEAVTGRPFAQHVHDAIFTPFKMTSSSFVWRPEYDATAARGHDGQGRVSESWMMRLARQADDVSRKGSKPVIEWTYADAEKGLAGTEFPVLPAMVTPNAAGSLFTTAGDYATFFTRVIENRARDGASLADELRAEMRRPQIQAAGAVSWGLGIGLETDIAPPAVWHWGDSGPAKTFALGDSKTGTGVVVLTNATRGLLLCERIVRALTGREHAAFLYV
jgi:CubicO group peptidase (beta-lactamase class C family)